MTGKPIAIVVPHNAQLFLDASTLGSIDLVERRARMIPYKLEFPGDWCPRVNTNRSSENEARARAVSPRSVLQQIGFAGLSLLATPALADELVKLPLPSGPRAGR
jgi:hypothetical protein